MSGYQPNRDVLKLLDKDVIRELAAGVPGFDRAGYLAALFHAWGGQEKFAQDVYLEFQRAAPGSLTRQRILDMVCRMLSQHSNDETVKPVDQLDDQELLQAIHANLPALNRIGVNDGQT